MQIKNNLIVIVALLSVLTISTVYCYNLNLSKKLLIASYIAYSTQSQINNWSCQYCSKFPLKNTHYINNQILNVSLYTGYSEEQNAIIISFRDTSNIQNWIATLDFNQANYPACSGCKVHEGIYNSYQSVAGYLRTDVQKLHQAHSGSKIYMTGFGVGGAWAVLAGLDCKAVFGRADSVYNFGSPRIGNQAFANFVTTTIVEHMRVIHYADIVPHLPPQAPVTYSHFASQIWYDAGMQKYKVCGAQQFSCSKSLLPNKWSTTDHDTAGYLKMLSFANEQEQEQEWWTRIFKKLLKLHLH